jgi:hypothetical protein
LPASVLLGVSGRFIWRGVQWCDWSEDDTTAAVVKANAETLASGERMKKDALGRADGKLRKRDRVDDAADIPSWMLRLDDPRTHAKLQRGPGPAEVPRPGIFARRSWGGFGKPRHPHAPVGRACSSSAGVF